jgi:mono/diheme cytochrome c family protein
MSDVGQAVAASRYGPASAVGAGRVAVFVVVVAGLFATTASAVADGNAKTGRTVAVKWCAKCHVVGDHNPHGGIESTLSFKAMAKRPERYPPDRFRRFKTRPPHPPFADSLDISTQDMEDLISFVATLRGD